MKISKKEITMAVSFIHVSNLCFTTPLGEVIFDHLSLSLQRRVSAIVGINGAGKSLLANIIAGRIAAASGNILARGRIGFVPQSWHGSESDTVSQVFGLDKPLAAMRRIAQGSLELNDFHSAESFWDWESRLHSCISSLGLNFTPVLSRKFSDYSGGQQIQILILSALISECEIIVLDEPTNHLDSESRFKLLNWIKTCDRMIVLISHDPYLLDCVEEIWELSGVGAHHYGGNYTLYQELQKQRQQSLAHDLDDIKKQQRQYQLSVQAAREKLQRRSAYGISTAAKKGRSKIEIGAAKEKSSAGLSAQRKSILARKSALSSRRNLVEEKLERIVPIAFDLPGSRLEAGKLVLELQDCAWGYNKALRETLNFSITGPQRVHLKGVNGIGKTTLLKTIAGQLHGLAGSCMTYVEVACLDQQHRFVNETVSAIQAYRLACPALKEQEYYDRLAWIGFRGESSQLTVSSLSGGNRMKLAIACLLLGEHTPQLLLLDEPSNHLDMNARNSLVQALTCYQGALMIASHDIDFVEKINCNVILQL